MFLWNFFHNSMAFCISSTDSKKETRSILHIFVATFSNFIFCNKTHIGAAQLFSRTAPICVLNLEVPGGFEPPHKGFADLCLTAWLRNQKMVEVTGLEPVTLCL